MIESEFDKLDQRLLQTNGRVIHQIWFNFKDPLSTSENPLPEKLKALREKWVNKNPDWTHILWNDSMGDWLVYKHYSIFWETYRNYPKPIQRVDTIRFCLLHRYGGIYTDMDTVCTKNISPLIDSIKYKSAFATSHLTQDYLGLPTVDNYFMYSIPNEELWLRLLSGTIKFGTGKKFLPSIVNTCTTSRWAQIIDNIKCKPGDYGTFKMDDVYSMKINVDKIDDTDMSKLNQYVIHVLARDWMNIPDILQLSLFILIIIIIIAIALMLSRKLINHLRYKNMGVSNHKNNNYG
jgi:mannosyltransferase OCH1-like enzyme